MARFAWEHVGKERESRVSEPTAAEQCASAFEATFPGRLGAIEKEAAIETVLAEFARLRHSARVGIAALFRETGMTP
jgi:hypothetical protein